MYFDRTYRSHIKKFFEKYNCTYLSFTANYHSVYFVIDDRVYCETEDIFKIVYPGTKILDPEKIYEEY